MKRITSYILLGILSLTLICCKESPFGQTPVDDVSPGRVTVENVTAVPGGAIIRYNAPADNDLLYVKAEYLRNGKIASTLSSSQVNTLKIEGLPPFTESTEVKLIAVDASKNESEPELVTINPLESPLITILDSFEPYADFGGFSARWENKTLVEIGITVLYDTLQSGSFKEGTTFYSETVKDSTLFGPFKDKKTSFKVYLTDKWGNQSPEKEFELTPFYEVLLDGNKFDLVEIITDHTPQYLGYFPDWHAMFDGKLDNAGFISDPKEDGFPVVMTFDFGQKVKLSKYRIFQRTELDLAFIHWNLKDYELWGTDHIDESTFTDKVYWSNGESAPWKNDWVQLTNSHVYKPSGDENPVSAEDVAAAKAGYSEKFRTSDAPVRYFRIVGKSTYAGWVGWQIGELMMWGDDKNFK
ncbi:MAG: DUF5000 domain-containing lipoprotein [Prolixibacteraceae bacterium]